MRPPPEGLVAEVDVDGVSVEHRRPLDLGGLVALLGVVSVVLYLAFEAEERLLGGRWIPPWAWALIFVGGLVFSIAVALLPSVWRLRINDRWLEVERTFMGRSHQKRIPLQALTRWSVEEAFQDADGLELVLREREVTHRVLTNMSREHLDWVVEVLDQMDAQRNQRAAIEGREWGFMQRVPEDLKVLIERE